MQLYIHFSTRNGSAYADGVYEGEKTIVKAGGKISDSFSSCIRGGTMARRMREDPNCVDENRNIIVDCTFSSPSTAVQFVSGRSLNGYDAWKIDKKKSLGAYLKEQGLR